MRDQIIFKGSFFLQVLQVDQVQDQAAELIVSIMKVTCFPQNECCVSYLPACVPA